jgi:hypothetical protein
MGRRADYTRFSSDLFFTRRIGPDKSVSFGRFNLEFRQQPNAFSQRDFVALADFREWVDGWWPALKPRPTALVAGTSRRGWGGFGRTRDFG